MAAIAEEPFLSRLERLDNVLKQVEAIRGGDHQSPKSSTASSTTVSSSSIDFSPKSLEKHCRPIDDVLRETELKGTLIERLTNVEDRVVKLYNQLHHELELFKNMNNMNKEKEEHKSSSSPKKGLKSLVKSCVKGKHKVKR